MNIRPTQIFLHGKTRFAPETVYGVEDRLGHYFCAHGWAQPVEDAATVTPAADALDAEPAKAAPGAGAEIAPYDGAAGQAAR
jgi:hypothetical protein